jgi:DNA-binding protein
MTEEKQKKTVKEEKTTKTVQTNENTVFIGKKPIMNYVIACLTFFNSGAQKVVVKARGRAISRAVDTVELLRRAFMKDLQLKDISIGTEEVSRGEGQKTNVSTIEITVIKP